MAFGGLHDLRSSGIFCWVNSSTESGRRQMFRVEYSSAESNFHWQSVRCVSSLYEASTSTIVISCVICSCLTSHITGTRIAEGYNQSMQEHCLSYSGTRRPWLLNIYICRFLLSWSSKESHWKLRAASRTDYTLCFISILDLVAYLVSNHISDMSC